jgi:shikimate dehydrogenase
MTKIFAIVGNPVFHSKSPLIFNSAFREISFDGIYIRCAAANAEEAMKLAREIGFDGFNVTSPFKADFLTCLDRLEDDALSLGSVNTVARSSDTFIGYNTDGDGVLGAVKTVFADMVGIKVVVLGAEGAAKSAVQALTTVGAQVVCVNRTFEKARAISEIYGCSAMPLAAIGEALQGARLLVSAISSNDPVVDPMFLRKELVVLDAAYGRSTPLIEASQKAGCTVIDGRLWLLHQALPAFTRFTGQNVPIDVVNRVLMKRRIDSRKNIALIGFMGTGKTAVAKALGSITKMDVVDIDTRVEKRAGMTIAEIFENQNEAAFRQLEQEELEEVRLDTRQIISCGGGIVMNKTNIRVLRNNCISVWLWARADTALERVENTSSRPLLASVDPVTAAANLLRRRIPYYARTCDLLIGTENKTPAQIAERIWHEVHHTFES